jgi:hypothetical protein
MKKKRTAQSGLFSLRLFLCLAAVCSMISGTLLAFFHSDAPAKNSDRMPTFAERVGYQRSIEEVYWRPLRGLALAQHPAHNLYR